MTEETCTQLTLEHDLEEEVLKILKGEIIDNPYIMAIKFVRQWRCDRDMEHGLVEAKNFVDQLRMAHDVTLRNCPLALRAEVVKRLKVAKWNHTYNLPYDMNNSRIGCIKFVKERSGMSLKESMDYVEEIAEKEGLKVDYSKL